MDQYPADSEAILLISLEKSANVVVGYYGDEKADFEIDRNCIDYL